MSSLTRSARTLFVSVSLAGLIVAGPAGCLQPGSPGWDAAPHTWRSTPSFPAQLALVDTRNQETVWTATVPVGGRVVTQFRDNRGDPGSTRPDLLVYTLHDADGMVSYGHLRKSVNVPSAEYRKWVLSPHDGTAKVGVTMGQTHIPFVPNNPVRSMGTASSMDTATDTAMMDSASTAVSTESDSASMMMSPAAPDSRPAQTSPTPMQSTGTTPGVVELIEEPDENTQRMLRDLILEPAADDKPAVLDDGE